MQWAITLGLIPLLLAMFQQVSLVSPIANAIAIPLVSLVVVPLTLLATLPSSDFMLVPAHAVLSGCMDAMQWMSDVPQAVWSQHAPPTWAVAAGLGAQTPAEIEAWPLRPRLAALGLLANGPAVAASAVNA